MTYPEWAKSIQDESSADALEDYLEGMCMGFLPYPVEDDLDYILTNEEAWWSGWEMVGRDMRKAIRQAIGESQEKKS